jgi:hypothetical protein
MPTQLLCTFCSEDELEKVVRHIFSSYQIAFNSVYVLENTDVERSLCLTYNVVTEATNSGIPYATISLHRKKSTNTLYTINALNLLIEELNDGQRNKDFRVPWEDYQNTILVTAYGKLKKINTKLRVIVTPENIDEIK